MGTWIPTFRKGESIIIRNVDEIVSYDPTVYETLIPQNIARLIVSPIYRDREVIGFYGIDNPPLDRMDHIAFYAPAPWTFYQFHAAAQRPGWETGNIKLP